MNNLKCLPGGRQNCNHLICSSLLKLKSSTPPTVNKMKRFLLFLPIIILLIIFSSSILSLKIGDSFLINGELDKAKTFYQISQRMQFFGSGLDQRLLAIEVARDERSVKTEITENLAPNLPQLPAQNTLGVNLTIPILMYHYIRVNPNPKDKIGFGLSVTPEVFTKQMDYLREHGFNTISLDELYFALQGQRNLPKRPIIITFDDGYADLYTAAYPILKAHDFKAISFVITGLVGAPNYLNWEQIAQMSSQDVVSFQSHTITHPALTRLNDASISQELRESKNVLQRYTGQMVNWLAYPFGSVNQKVANLVSQTGYFGALGTNNGTIHNTNRMFALPRVRINGGDSLATFASKLPWKD